MVLFVLLGLSLVLCCWLGVSLVSLKGYRKDAVVVPYSTVGIVSVALLLAVFVVSMFLLFQSEGVTIKGDVGQVGDFVGGLINPILSFLALLVILRTSLIQTKEFAKSNDILTYQKAVSEKEKFENTFFKLIDRMESYSAGVMQAPKPGSAKKRAQYYFLMLQEEREALDELPLAEGVVASVKYIRSVVKADNRLITFARRCYQPLFFIEESELRDADKTFYLHIYMDTFGIFELNLFLTMATAYSYQSLNLCRKYDMARGLKNEAFASEHIAKVVGKEDTSHVYPFIRTKSTGEQEYHPSADGFRLSASGL